MIEPIRRLCRAVYRWLRYSRREQYVAIKDDWIRNDFRI